jgi:hypothetical protein
MNLDDFVPPPIKEAEVVDDGPIVHEEPKPPVCSRCEVEGSLSLPNGTCDTCGSVWQPNDDDDADDFQVSIELLMSCADFFEKLLKNQKVMHKMSWQ